MWEPRGKAAEERGGPRTAARARVGRRGGHGAGQTGPRTEVWWRRPGLSPGHGGSERSAGLGPSGSLWSVDGDLKH